MVLLHCGRVGRRRFFIKSPSFDGLLSFIPVLLGIPDVGSGYWVVGTGYWVLGTGYWVLGTG